MPRDEKALHHEKSDESKVALLLIDVINPLEFEGAENLLKRALPVAEAIADLKSRAKRSGVPVVYVNDNFGRWQSDFTRVVEYCLNDTPGKKMVELLRPDEDDYFVLKPKHSGFFLTSLYTLLRDLGVETIILCGVATDICVLFTANDAYMQDFKLIVPPDGVAAEREDYGDEALRIMERVLKADLRPAAEIDFGALIEA